MFVLRIGSNERLPGCSMGEGGSVSGDQTNELDKGVVLQYSTNKGIQWRTINSHDPAEFGKVCQFIISI